MDIIGAKILAGFLFFFLAFIFGWMPYFCFRRCFGSRKSNLAHRSENRRPAVVQYLHSLASGVMLATCYLHLLPESLDAVRAAMFYKYTQSHDVTNITNFELVGGEGQSQVAGHRFPVAECLVALGFLLIYMIDSVIRSCSRPCNNGSHFQGSSDLSTSTDPRTNLDTDTSHETDLQTVGQWKTISALKNKISSQVKVSWARPKFSRTLRLTVPRDVTDQSEALTESDLGGNSHEDIDLRGLSGPQSEISASSTGSFSVESHPLATLPTHPGQTVGLKSLALVSALCIHGFFDGVMIGLQTSLPVVTSLLIALSIHKSFVAVGLSLTFLASNDKIRDCITLLYIFLFALVAPLGLLVSAAFLHRTFETASDREVSLVPGCLQSVAVGTFLYVTLTELTERECRRSGFTSFVIIHLFLLVGFGLMAVLRAFLGST